MSASTNGRSGQAGTESRSGGFRPETPTLIGTIYGMNFDHMPELHWTFGYPSAVILMLVLSVALYAMFKRQHWL